MLRNLRLQRLLPFLGSLAQLVIGVVASSSVVSATECPQFRAEGIWQSLKTDKMFYIQQSECTSATVTPLASRAVTYSIRTDGATPSVMPRAFYYGLANRNLDAIDGGTFTARLSGSTVSFDFNALLRPIEATLRRFVVRALGTGQVTLAPPQDSDFQGCLYADGSSCDQPTVQRYLQLAQVMPHRYQVLSISGTVRQTQVSAPRALISILQSFGRGRTFRPRRLEGLSGSDQLIRVNDNRSGDLDMRIICNPRVVRSLKISRQCPTNSQTNVFIPPTSSVDASATGAE